jgi:hypothetical protein
MSVIALRRSSSSPRWADTFHWTNCNLCRWRHVLVGYCSFSTAYFSALVGHNPHDVSHCRFWPMCWGGTTCCSTRQSMP